MTETADEIPSGTALYALSEHERYPTLYVDDCTWRGDPMGTEPPGFYPHDRTVILPNALVMMWEKARADLAAVEQLILEIERVQEALQPLQPLPLRTPTRSQL